MLNLPSPSTESQAGNGSPTPERVVVAAFSDAGRHAPALVPDYELLRRIGAGAYGEVWLARSKATGAFRAAKIVWRHRFEDERPFQREFEGIRKFERISREHPSQLALFHIGRNDPEGYFYYVMELADHAVEHAAENGGSRIEDGAKARRPPYHPPSSILDPHTYSPHTLRADLQKGRLPAARVLEVGLSLAEALGHLHRHGLIHRDVKPSNVIFVNGRPKLADIGLVTDTSDQCSIVGTEGYLPPEGPGTPQADIFALGKVLYEAATGLDRREFPKLPEDLRSWPDAKRVFELNEVVLRACAPAGYTRYGSAEALAIDLNLLKDGRSVRRAHQIEQGWRQIGRGAKWLAAGAVALGSMVFLTRVQQPPAGQAPKPAVSSIQLSGQPQTMWDSFHPYAQLSASVGADVSLRITASGTPPLHYQWRFNQSDLPGQTNAVLRFTSLRLTNGGDYRVVVTNNSGSTTSQVATLVVDPTFTRITSSPVVTNADTSQGGFWGDYTNDGLLDLFVVNGLTSNPFLFRNNGDGTFAQIVGVPPVNVLAQAPSACWGDYDNDGNLDLFVATTSLHYLYHNSGDGTFTRILSGSPVTDIANSCGCTWVDFNGDGYLDLFVTVLDVSASSHCFLYRNNGDGTFTPVTDSVLVTDSGSSVGCAFGDYDNDGKPDLFVCGGRGFGTPVAPNRLYHNNGDGTFTRIMVGSIATDLGHSGCCAWADYDNDGYLDLFVNNSFGGQNFLYHNNGNGTFTRITNSIIATDKGNWCGCAWGDYDNDGFLDLYVAREGHTNIAPIVVNALYHNNGDGTFTKITNGSPVNEYSDSVGCAWADYDNDGFLDLFATRANGRGNLLYHNNGNTNAWLEVKLVGTVANRAAIGAKMRVKAFYRGASRWQLRQITGGGGWGGQQELRANFGLGDATNADIVRVEWPSGTVQELHNVAPRQILTITEPPRLNALSAPVRDRRLSLRR